MLKVTLEINTKVESDMTPGALPTQKSLHLNQRQCYQVTSQTRPMRGLKSFKNDISCIDPEHDKESYSHHPRWDEIKEAHRPSDLAKFQHDEMNERKEQRAGLSLEANVPEETHYQIAKMTAFSCCFKSPLLSSSESYMIQIHIVWPKIFIWRIPWPHLQ